MWPLAAFLLCLALASAAHAEGRRIALVIGNGNYLHAPKLDNPVNDANGVAAALEGLGFEVQKGIDLDISGFRKIVRSFAERLSGADVGLFFYA
ncbi:MAG: caspase family protein, partial [Geminicoccaceae bacterium]